MTASRLLAVVTMLLAVYLCSSASVATQEPFALRTQTSVKYGNAYFRVKVPTTPKTRLAARGIHPFYLSASTRSFVISTDGSAPLITNVNQETGYATATLRRIPVGTHSFQVTAYDKPYGRGNILSAGDSGPVYVTPGYVNVYLTLSGVVAAVALVLDYPFVTDGSPAVINLNVIAKDVDGNVIISKPGDPAQPFARPFTLTTSDAVNGKLSQTTVEESAGSNGLRVSVAYSGADVPPIVFSATGAGINPLAVMPATLAPGKPPTSGEQLIAEAYDDPITSLSTTPFHQLLATIGGSTLYDGIAADAITGLIYAENQDYQKSRIDIYAGGGSYGLIGSISVPHAFFGGLTVDSAGGRLFVAVRGEKSSHIAIYSAATGHALLGTIPMDRFGDPSLAIDSTAGLLYVSGCPDAFNCGTGFEVFSTTAPYKKLGSYGTKSIFETSYCAVAVDPVTERVFLSECNSANENPSYVDVYEAANLKTPIARIGPLTPAAQIAIDAKARVLYVTNEPASVYTYDYSVNMYSLDSGFQLVGSLPIRSVHHITVAPYAH